MRAFLEVLKVWHLQLIKTRPWNDRGRHLFYCSSSEVESSNVCGDLRKTFQHGAITEIKYIQRFQVDVGEKNLCNFWRFTIKRGSFTRFEQPLRSKSSRLVAFPMKEGSYNNCGRLLMSNVRRLTAFSMLDNPPSSRLAHPERSSFSKDSKFMLLGRTSLAYCILLISVSATS